MDPVPPLLAPVDVPAFTIATSPDRALRAAGSDLVAQVSAHTGIPKPDLWPRPALLARTRERQDAALDVWLASDAGGNVIGHALLSAVNPTSATARNPAVAGALADGTVLELGGLAVAASWHGRGVARALRDARLAYAELLFPDAAVITACRPGGPADQWYSRHWDFLGTAAGCVEPVVRIHRLPGGLVLTA